MSNQLNEEAIKKQQQDPDFRQVPIKPATQDPKSGDKLNRTEG